VEHADAVEVVCSGRVNENDLLDDVTRALITYRIKEKNASAVLDSMRVMASHLRRMNRYTDHKKRALAQLSEVDQSKLTALLEKVPRTVRSPDGSLGS